MAPFRIYSKYFGVILKSLHPSPSNLTFCTLSSKQMALLVSPLMYCMLP